MSQQSLQRYMPSNTSDDAANIARKQNEQRSDNHKRKMTLRKRKQPKFRMLGDIYRETVMLSDSVPNLKTTIASSSVQPIDMKVGKGGKKYTLKTIRGGKLICIEGNYKKFRMLADLYKDTQVLPAAISSNNPARARGCGQHGITEANPPSQKVIMAAIQLLRISNGVVHTKVSSTKTEEPSSAAGKISCRNTAEYEIRSPVCRVNKNPAEFGISASNMFMRSV